MNVTITRRNNDHETSGTARLIEAKMAARYACAVASFSIVVVVVVLVTTMAVR